MQFDISFSSAAPPAEKERWIARIALVGLLVYLGGAFVIQATFVLNPDYLHEELRPLYRYHLVSDPTLFPGDYLTAFVTSLPQPYLYEWTTRLWILVGGDLQILHRLLPVLCWLAFLAGLAVAAGRVGDRVTQVAALGLAIAQPIYLYQITSALPHAFAFALLIWAFVALQCGSARGLAAATVLSALIYPAAAPLVGLLLAWQLLVTDGVVAVPNRERIKRLLLLAVCGALSLWLLLHSLSGTTEFGAPLEPLQQAETYPENGPRGRHFYGVFNPLMYVLAKAYVQFRDVFDNDRFYLLLIYGVIAGYGLLIVCRNGATRRSVAVFITCSAAVFLLVLLFKPFHLYRFVLYPALTILPLLLAVGLQDVFRRIGGYVGLPVTTVIAALFLLLLAFDSLSYKKIGYWLRLEPEQQRLLDFAAAQPPQTLFATWPDSGSHIEFLPYLARRPLFVMHKLHYPVYESYTLQMRERMDVLIDAYLATDELALRRLYCEWGVNYMIVEKAHFTEADARPRYFAPFDRRIEEIWSQHHKEGFLLRSPKPSAVAVETERYIVLRLEAFAGATPGAAACRASAESRAEAAN